MRHRIYLRLALTMVAPSFFFGQGLAATVASETRSILQEWVQVRTLISEEKEDWAIEEADLKDTIDLLRQEKAMLEEQIASREQAAAEATDARSQLADKREVLDAQATELSTILSRHEAEIKEWSESLPSVLKETIAPLIRRLPANTESANALGLARRLQSVVGIMSQADRFNSTLTFRSELRTDEATGAQRETDTLYFGLAFALFSDPEGQNAGIGIPGPEGWTWESAPESASAIRQLLAVYRNEVRAAYVSVPLVIE